MSDPETSTLPPYDRRRNALAKLLSASMMGLREDATGSNLPEDIWHQLLPKADAMLFIVSDADKAEAGRKLEQGADPYHGPG